MNISKNKNISIYFLRAGSHGNAIKIGYTEKPIEERIAQLQTGNDKNLILVAYLENQPIHMEKHIHDICDRFKYRGEWFDIHCLRFLLNHPFYKANIKVIKKDRELGIE